MRARHSGSRPGAAAECHGTVYSSTALVTFRQDAKMVWQWAVYAAACAACVLRAPIANADTVYITNNANMDDAHSTLYAIETTSKKIRNVTVFESGKGQPSMNVYDAALCGRTYYGIIADITVNAFGLVVTDVMTGKWNFVQTPQLYHAVSCNPHSETSVLAVGSVAGQPHAQFSLRVFDPKAGNDTQVALLSNEIFYGYDASFVFNQAGTQLYYGGGKDSGMPLDGQFTIMDTSTAKIVGGPYKLGLGVLPYSFCPDTKPLQGMVMTGGISDPQFWWAHFEPAGQRAKERRTAKADQYFSTGPMPVCGTTMYAMSNQNQTPLIRVVEAQTGKLISTVDLPFKTDGYFLGGVACTK